jgi:hypothetical protein
MMAAIQPARLKLQTARLVENFNDPHTFGQALDSLLDYYAEHLPARAK